MPGGGGNDTMILWPWGLSYYHQVYFHKLFAKPHVCCQSKSSKWNVMQIRGVWPTRTLKAFIKREYTFRLDYTWLLYSSLSFKSNWTHSCRQSGTVTVFGNRRIHFYWMVSQTIYTTFQRNMVWKTAVSISNINGTEQIQ